MLISDIITNNAERFPDKIGIVDEGGVRLTWREVNSRVNSLAHAMLDMGVGRGDRVTLVSQNSHQCGEFLFAVAKIGAVGAGVNYRLTGEQLVSTINDCQPKAIFVQNQLAPAVAAVLPRLGSVGDHVIGMGEGHGCRYDYERLIDQYPSDEPRIRVTEDDRDAIIYTSGTTGVPKGAVFTHKARVAICEQMCSAVQLQPSDVLLVGVPMCAAGGQFHFLMTCYAGATAALHVFSGHGFCEMVEREKVTISFVTPTRYRMVRDYLDSSGRRYDFSSLRSLPIGSQSIAREALQEMLDFFGVSRSVKVYGMSESGPVAGLSVEDVMAGLRPHATEKERKRMESVGKQLPRTMIKIVDNNGQDVPAGQEGEIITRGDGLMEGYWHRPESTAEVIRHGWYHTNDIGMLDDDGFLYFLGRKDDMIRSGGFFVSPVEVERVIGLHPAVGEVAVFGVPDAKWGEAVKAVIALKDGKTVTEAELTGHCRAHLAGYQIPKTMDFVGSLPKDKATGKILVRELRNSP